MSGLLRMAHAPSWPGDHDRLACCARVRGLRPPPPFAALTPAATPWVRAEPRLLALNGKRRVSDPSVWDQSPPDSCEGVHGWTVAVYRSQRIPRIHQSA